MIAMPPPAAERALARLDRRGFLRLAGAAAALAPGALGACAEGGGKARAGVLAPREARVLRAAVAALAGPAAGARIAAGALDPAEVADRWLAALPDRAPALRGALWLLELGIWPLTPRLRPFTALAPAQREALLRGLRDSRFAWKRGLFRGLKAFCTLVYYAHPASWAAAGYPGPFGGPDGAGIDAAMRYDLSALGYDARAPEPGPVPAAERIRRRIDRENPCTPPSTPRRIPTSPPPSSSPADG